MTSRILGRKQCCWRGQQNSRSDKSADWGWDTGKCSWNDARGKAGRIKENGVRWRTSMKVSEKESFALHMRLMDANMDTITQYRLKWSSYFCIMENVQILWWMRNLKKFKKSKSVARDEQEWTKGSDRENHQNIVIDDKVENSKRIVFVEVKLQDLRDRWTNLDKNQQIGKFNEHDVPDVRVACRARCVSE